MVNRPEFIKVPNIWRMIQNYLHLVQKGIKLISDLLDIDGNLYQFDVLKETYDINGTFLDYQS